MAKLAITWKKSAIGVPPGQRRTIAGLGLRRLNQTVEHDDTPPIRGMVNKVRHLIEVVPISESKKKRS
jgi:large subunit ribosomal protein L30